MSGFWNVKTTASEILTSELLEKAFEQLKARADWEYQNPHGTKHNPHIVHPKTVERGYGHCVECGAFLGEHPGSPRSRPGPRSCKPGKAGFVSSSSSGLGAGGQAVTVIECARGHTLELQPALFMLEEGGPLHVLLRVRVDGRTTTFSLLGPEAREQLARALLGDGGLGGVSVTEEEK